MKYKVGDRVKNVRIRDGSLGLGTLVARIGDVFEIAETASPPCSG